MVREQYWLGFSASAVHGDRGTGTSFAQPECLEVNKGINFHLIKSERDSTERAIHIKRKNF